MFKTLKFTVAEAHRMFTDDYQKSLYKHGTLDDIIDHTMYAFSKLWGASCCEIVAGAAYFSIIHNGPEHTAATGLQFRDPSMFQSFDPHEYWPGQARVIRFRWSMYLPYSPSDAHITAP